MSSNVSGLPDQINYDMDTSIVIQSNHSKEVFFNGVDNPLTVNNYKKVKNFITKYFNKKIAAAAGGFILCKKEVMLRHLHLRQNLLLI